MVSPVRVQVKSRSFLLPPESSFPPRTVSSLAPPFKCAYSFNLHQRWSEQIAHSRAMLDYRTTRRTVRRSRWATSVLVIDTHISRLQRRYLLVDGLLAQWIVPETNVTSPPQLPIVHQRLDIAYLVSLKVEPL